MFVNKDLIETLAHSKIYQDYERAFTDATGLPVNMRPVESWQLPHRGSKNENPFCALMARRSGSCAACLRIQEELSQTAQHEPKTATYFSGMSDSAVPVRSGDDVVGFLQTGQIFRKKPTAAGIGKMEKQLAEWGLDPNDAELREAYSRRGFWRRSNTMRW